MDLARKRVDRRLRLEMVWDAINEAPEPCDMGEIAARAGLKRTPYLADLVNELLAHGYILKGLATGTRGHARVVYWTHQAPYEQIDLSIV